MSLNLKFKADINENDSGETSEEASISEEGFTTYDFYIIVVHNSCNF